jgi:hypothetical protein
MCLGAMRLLAAFFERTDALGLHLHSNRETRGIITANDPARMQPTTGAELCRLTPGVREVMGNNAGYDWPIVPHCRSPLICRDRF